MLNDVTLSRLYTRRWYKMIGMMKTSKTVMKVALLLVLSALASASTLAESEIKNLNSVEAVNIAPPIKYTKAENRQYNFNALMIPPPVVPVSPPGCPACDSSVYSYCSFKLLHDACCCYFPGTATYQRPPQCTFSDCIILHAKSCYEYSLIKNCCCNNNAY